MTLALALLLGQVIQPGQGPHAPGIREPAPVAFTYYAQSSGAMIPDDANTVSHVYWDGTRIHDTILGDAAWTQNGTVPQVASGPFYPHGFSQPAKAGAGPFSVANYYSLPAGNALDFAGDFSICIIYTQLGTAANDYFVSALSGAAGFWIQFASGGSSPYIYFGQSGTVTEAITVPTLGPHVFCASRGGASVNVLADSYVSASGSAGTVTQYTGAASLGIAPGNPSPDIVLNEFWAATGDHHAQFQRIEQGVFGILASGGVPVTNSRSSTATDMIAGTLYTWPPNVSRIGANGVEAEPPSTNSALYSQQFDNADWVKTSVTVTANTTTAPDTTVTADTLADTASGGNVSGAATTATASPYTVSAWLQTSTGTQAAQLDLYDATTSTVLCSATPTVTTTATRYSCSLTTNATAGDALVPRVWPGGTAGSGTTIAWGAQIEALPFMTSYTGEVLGTPVTRSADGITAVVPTAPQACGKINGAAMACQAFTGTTLSLPGSLSGGSTSTPQSLLDLCVGQGLAVCGP